MTDSAVLFDKTDKNTNVEKQIIPIGSQDGGMTRIYRRQIRGDWLDEAAKDQIKKEISNKQKFEELVLKSENNLYKLKSVFPFAFFPEKITIDPVKVSVVSKEFFSSERIHCIYIKNILDVFLSSGPIFATLKIVDQSFTENTVTISFLKKNEAFKARKIIQGLIVAHQQEINVTGLQDDNLIEKLEKIGTA